MSDLSPVLVRFAPSPTGLLHIGGLRTALYNYLLARRTGGAFVLRIEDTDQERFVAEAEADIAESLRWAGLDWDEGPGIGGPHAPYRQSERSALYREAADRLMASGAAYVAFDTPEEVEAMRTRRATPENPTPAYNAATRGEMRNAHTLPSDEVQRLLDAGTPHVVRLHVTPGEEVTFTDAVRGDVTFGSDTVDDQVLLKSDGLPTYHLANVVDDHAMGITDVIRGEEWLPSTPKHVLLYRALGYAPPRFAHLPLILSPTGGKLSKRNAEKMGIPINVRDYRAAGYEPEALVNFLALLGWNPGDDREVMTLAELIEAFSVDRIGQSGTKFDLDKLAWFNGQYLRRRTPAEIATEVLPLVEAAYGPVDMGYLKRVAALMHERLSFTRDLALFSYFFKDPETYDEAGVNKRWKDASAGLMRAYADALDALDPFDAATADAALRGLAEAQGVGAGQLIHPTRLAVTGRTEGAGLFETMEVLGQAACVRRLRRAADRLG
jgi:glutamyl-tRNA synthetase